MPHHIQTNVGTNGAKHGTLAQVVLQQHQQANQSRLSPQPKQLLISIPSPSVHSPHSGGGTLNSPHLQSMHHQSPSITIKQAQISIPTTTAHENLQALHMSSSKAQMTPKSESVTISMQQQQQHSQSQIYTSYASQTIPPQQQQPSYLHTSVQDTSVTVSTTIATASSPAPSTVNSQKLLMPSGILGLSGHSLSHHPTIHVIQAKTSVPKQSPTALTGSGNSSTPSSIGLVNSSHIQHPGIIAAAGASTATPSPPPISSMQPQQHQLLIKPSSSSPLLHSTTAAGGATMVPLMKPSTPQPPTQQQQQTIIALTGKIIDQIILIY